MESSNRSPVMTYKIALVNNANLNQQFVTVGEKEIKQFEYASKRLMRAVRKARKMAQAGNRSIMLFCQRENGQHFPINYRKAQYEMSGEPLGMGARMALNLAVPGIPINEQIKGMEMYRELSKQRATGGSVPDELVDKYYRPKKEA